MVNILLEQGELNEIARKIRITKHAIDRVQEFLGKDITTFEIKRLIKVSPLAWKQNNGQYVVVVDEFSYFIIYKYFNSYALVSYLRKSENKYTPIDKFILEYKGVKKKWKDEEKERT